MHGPSRFFNFTISFPISTSCGSYGAITGAAKAIKKMKPISKRPILPDRLDQSHLKVLFHTDIGSCNNKSSSKLSDNVFETFPNLLI